MMGPHARLFFLAAVVVTLARHGVEGVGLRIGSKSAQGEGRPCIIYQTSPWGFCSNLHGLLMTLAVYSNTSDIYLDERGWSYKCSKNSGTWHKFFAGTPRDRLNAASPGDCEVLTYEGCPRCGHDVLADVPVAATFALLGQAVKQLWKLSSSMQGLADIQAQYLASLPRPLAAIHIRAGDKGWEDHRVGRNPEWYKEDGWVLVLQELLRKGGMPVQEGGGTCLVFGDDLLAMHQAVILLQSRVQCAIITFGGSVGGHNQLDMNEKWTRASACRSTRDIILALHALASADVFVGNYNSNIPRFVHLLRHHVFGKAVSSSGDVYNHSAGWSHHYNGNNHSIGAERQVYV